MNEYLDQRIVQMFVSKIYRHRTTIANQFAIRNKSSYPELTRQIIGKEIRDLKMWRYLLTKLENKIKWISSKKLSVYFINQLLQEPKLIEEKYMWSKLENLFIDKDGKPMDRGAQENQKIFGDSREARLPSNYMIINTILKGFRD